MNTTIAKTELLRLLCDTDDEKQMAKLLNGLFTTHELDEVVTRLQIVRLLLEKVPQREIASRLGVGIATVTRGSRALQGGKFKGIIPDSWRTSEF